MAVIARIGDLDDDSLRARLTRRIDGKTKPLGALGAIESLAIRVGMIVGSPAPRLDEPQLVVFAADHGLARHRTSAYPSDVTAQMVRNFLDGGAAVSVLARQHGLALGVVDCGVRTAAPPRAGLIDRRIAAGTADALEGPAMSVAQCLRAIDNGIAVVDALPGNALLLGEMGIGNTSAAALLLARLTGWPIDDCVGRGTGLDDAGLAHKREILRRVMARDAAMAHGGAGIAGAARDLLGDGGARALAALASLGGFEIATMVGAVLSAAADRRVVVVDGLIASVAVLVAERLAPRVRQRCVFAHRSAEAAHGRLLAHWDVEPLLQLGLRLGEGSGAALAWPLIVSACRLLDEMASFDDAGVAGPA
ncbi:MAG: nicotinate-nucleotide--dimethylbenzimidazole phosphoribosyltransferase [Burkholderiaceae bacterium]